MNISIGLNENLITKRTSPLCSWQLENAPCVSAASGRVCTMQPDETQHRQLAAAWSLTGKVGVSWGKCHVKPKNTQLSFIPAVQVSPPCQTPTEMKRQRTRSDHLTWGLCSPSSPKATHSLLWEGKNPGYQDYRKPWDTKLRFCSVPFNNFTHWLQITSMRNLLVFSEISKNVRHFC